MIYVLTLNVLQFYLAAEMLTHPTGRQNIVSNVSKKTNTRININRKLAGVAMQTPSDQLRSPWSLR